jgi:hypothetical protein
MRLSMLRTRAADERGSVIMAMLAVTVVSMALMALLSSVQGGLKAAQVDEARINAFQHANGGIDLAAYRIDRGDFTGSTAIPDGFRDVVSLDNGDEYVVEAVRTYPGYDHTWTVRSTGTDASGRQRQAVATISTPRLFRHGFFTLQRFYLKGSQLTPVAYDSRACPSAASTCELPSPAPGRIGTNADIVLANATAEQFINRWEGFDMYGRATQEAADLACDAGNCGTFPKVQAFPNRLYDDPGELIPAVPSGALPCPGGGRLNGAVIQPGDYLCNSLDLDGVIDVGTAGNGSGTVRIWVQGPFSAARNTVLNAYQRTVKVQIFQAAMPSGGSWNGSVCGAELWAVLYTPGLTIDCEGSHQPTIYGAVVANIHMGNGNHFDFHWDVSAMELTSDEGYTVSNWRECPVGVDDC